MPGADAAVWANATWFAAGAVAIGMAGTQMAAFADRLADRTGLGEAITGALFLGATTSLPGITASVTAAVEGYPVLAVSNAMGGIAAQTAFLAIADVFHKQANLEHAAAEPGNMIQATLLVVLLVVVVLAMSGPPMVIGHVGTATPALFIAYAFGLRLAVRTTRRPMWKPTMTRQTVEDRPDEGAPAQSLAGLSAGFAATAAIVLAGGVTVARSGAAIVATTGMSESLMGGLFTAVSTSLPELVTTIAAVRRGALALAVGDIVGGNAFDVLFICVADLVYLDGSIYQACGMSEVFLASLAILLNVILLMGLIHREKHGIANIGFESMLILVLYVLGISGLALAR